MATYPIDKNPPKYTVQDYDVWEGRWELVHGRPFAKHPMPSIRHQDLSLRLCNELNQTIEQADGCGNCRAYLPIDWKVDEHTVVQPDISVLCGDVSGVTRLEFAPKLVVEVLSPGSVLHDKNTKRAIYEKAGVAYYIMVDPDGEVLILQNSPTGFTAIYEGKGEATTFAWDDCEFEVDFSQVW